MKIVNESCLSDEEISFARRSQGFIKITSQKHSYLQAGFLLILFCSRILGRNANASLKKYGALNEEHLDLYSALDFRKNIHRD